jgi:hypothetical protein
LQEEIKMNEYDMKTAAKVLAATLGKDEDSIHTLLRGWNKDSLIRPKKSGDNTSPLLYSPRDLYRIAIILKVREYFPKLSPRYTELWFSWTGAETKVSASPDGTHTSYSLEGALAGVRKGHAWRIIIDLENDFIPLRFAPTINGSSVEVSGAFLSLPANELLQSLEQELGDAA